MKTFTRIALCSITLLAAAAGRAQSTAEDRGTLGQSYAELSFGVSDIRHAAPNFYDLSFGGNMPIAPGLDAGGSFSHGWLDRHLPGHTNTLGGTLTAYRALQGAKPFVSAGLGYQWWSVGADDSWVWNATAGVQFTLGRLALTPRLVYVDDFLRSATSTQQWTAEVEANHWISRSTALFATFGHTDVRRSPFDAWNWRAGVRLAF